MTIKLPGFLLNTLTLPRPAKHKLESKFVDTVLKPAIAAAIAGKPYNMTVDGYGNVWVKYSGKDNPRAGERTLITSHTDTANSYRYNNGKKGLLPEVQHLVGIEDKGNIYIWLDTSKPVSGCMGADDGAGMALAMAMLEATKPYDFVFYREEEIGGRGSSWSVRNNRSWYSAYARAIAFDRRGVADVITHQGMRCASDQFGRALADMLNKGNQRFVYKPSEHGIFTDTANLTDDVPECTNISVGYTNEHTTKESLNFTHWSALRDVIVSPRCNFNTLPTVRKCGEDDYLHATWLGKSDPYDYDYDYDYDTGYHTSYDKDKDKDKDKDNIFDELSDEDWLKYIREDGDQAASDLIWYDPTLAARLLTLLARY